MSKKDIIIPESWDEVSLGKFEKIARIEVVDGEGDVEQSKKIIKILVNIDDDEIINELFKTHLNEVVGALQFLTTPPVKKDDLREVKLGKTKYRVIEDLNSITFGEMFSFETLAQQEKLTTNESISLHLAIFLREVDKEGNLKEFDANRVYEMWDKVMEINIVDALSISSFFFQWRTDTLINFRGLFSGGEDDDNTPSGLAMDSKWSWYGLLNKLANEDITKFDGVSQQTYISCLNQLAYWKERDMVTERMRRRAEMRKQNRTNYR